MIAASDARPSAQGAAIVTAALVKLTYDALKPLTNDAGAKRACSAGHNAFCDSRPVLRAESSGCLDNGTCGGTEAINEGPIVGRCVIGTFGASGGNRDGAYSNRADIAPELILILHLLIHSPTRSQETAHAGRQPQHVPRASHWSGLALTRHTP